MMDPLPIGCHSAKDRQRSRLLIVPLRLSFTRTFAPRFKQGIDESTDIDWFNELVDSMLNPLVRKLAMDSNGILAR